MRAHQPGNRRGFRPGAFLALWVVALAVAPRSAQADCTHPDRPAIGLAVAGDLIRGDLGSDARDSRISPAEPVTPKPCSGPQCSGKSAPSPGTAPIVRFTDFDSSWAWLALTVGPDPDHSAPLRPEDSAAAGSAHPAPIFHPPRHSR